MKMLTRPVSDQSIPLGSGGEPDAADPPGYPYGEIASLRSVPSIGRTTSGTRRSVPSTESVSVTPSAARNSGERKNCSRSAAASPPSSIRRAFTAVWPSLVRRLGLIFGKAAPELDIDQLLSVPHVPAEDALLLPAVVDVGLLVGEPLGLAADPFSGDPLVADDRPEFRRGLPAEAVEGRIANRLVDPLHLDRPFAILRLRVIALLDRPLHPAPGVILGERLAMLEQVGRRRRAVEPAVNRLRVLGPEVPKRDTPCHRPATLAVLPGPRRGFLPLRGLAEE